MAQINENYFKLQAGYLFPEIGRRVREYQKENPQADIIRYGYWRCHSATYAGSHPRFS